jgi:CheY-like chemotaxis protein
MPKTVLVDDNDDIRTVLSMSLIQRGFDVVTYPDGESALAKIAQDHPDIAIIDSSLPGISGLEVGRRIRQRFPVESGIILVLFTGSGCSILSQQATDAGFNLFLTKPVSVNELCSQLEKITQGKNQ